MKINTLKINKSLFTGNHITEEGLYLWKHSVGVELIRVYRVPYKTGFGMSWDSYLAYGSNRRNICNLQGEFVKVEFE